MSSRPTWGVEMTFKNQERRKENVKGAFEVPTVASTARVPRRVPPPSTACSLCQRPRPLSVQLRHGIRSVDCGARRGRVCWLARSTLCLRGPVVSVHVTLAHRLSTWLPGRRGEGKTPFLGLWPLEPLWGSSSPLPPLLSSPALHKPPVCRVGCSQPTAPRHCPALYFHVCVRTGRSREWKVRFTEA